MAKLKPTKFDRGHKVKIKGRKGMHTITWPMVVPVPTIVNYQFTIIDTAIYKFITEKETYYAYEKDCTT